VISSHTLLLCCTSLEPPSHQRRQLPPLSSDRNGLVLCRWTNTLLQSRPGLRVPTLLGILFDAFLPRQKATLSHRAPARCTWQSATRNSVNAATVHPRAGVAVAGAFCGDGTATGVCKLLGKGRHVGDCVCRGMLGANIGHARVGGFAGLGESIVAGVEVFAFLLRLGEVSGKRRRRMKGTQDKDAEVLTYFELILK